MNIFKQIKDRRYDLFLKGKYTNTSLVFTILVSIPIILLIFILSYSSSTINLKNYLGINPLVETSKHLYWNILIFPFISTDILELLSSLILTYYLGNKIEEVYHSIRFMGAYYFTVFPALFFTYLTNYFFNDIIIFNDNILGNRTCLMGLIGFSIALFGNLKINLLLIGDIKIKIVLITLFVLEFITNLLSQKFNTVFSLFGGLMWGIIYGKYYTSSKYIAKIDLFFSWLYQTINGKKDEKILMKNRPLQQVNKIYKINLNISDIKIIDREAADKLLDKISKKGIDSLTQKEKLNLDIYSRHLKDQDEDNEI